MGRNEKYGYERGGEVLASSEWQSCGKVSAHHFDFRLTGYAHLREYSTEIQKPNDWRVQSG